MAKGENVYAYAGNILRINLSNGEVQKEPTSTYAREWLGSPGIAIKILYDELRPWVTPYAPTNKIIFGAGALMGTPAPGACKMSVSTLSPVTGGWGTGCSDSYVGGQMKYAGYDSIVIEGRAHTSVYLYINDDGVEIRDALHLWGKTTWDTLEALREELGDSKIHSLTIGPAGENMVRGACIIQDKGRAFGRCGSGSVMGSKNLKAVVAKGSGPIQIARPKEFMEAGRKIRRMFKKAVTLENMQKYGSLAILETKQALCGVNYKNFQDVHFPDEMVEAIDPKKTIEKYQVARQSFPGCVIGCGRHLHLTDGPYAGLKTETNQFEVVLTLQGRFAIQEPTFMYKANAYCNQLGLDIDATGGAIGWAMECYQRGILDEKDTDGLKLEWGDAAVVLQLMRKIAYREGFGNILAEGSARAADILGRDSGYYAMHIKKQDLYEPCRGSMAWCLGATTSTRGGGHTTGAPACEGNPGQDVERMKEVYGIPNPHKPQEYENKAEMVQYYEVLHRVNNCLGVCHYNTTWLDVEMMDLPHLTELYTAATGWKTTVEDFTRLSDRQLNLEKAFNLRFTDFDRKDDMPTPRDLNEPIPTGNLAGWKMDEEKYNKLLDEYYDLHGWDRETSYPKRKTLVDLGLDYVADDLAKIGKLG